MERWHLKLVAALSGALLATVNAGAQPRVRIPDAPSCPSCRIASTSVAVLTGIPDTHALRSAPQNVVEGARGELWLFDEQAPILVFDAKGKFLRTFGQTGSGPGEMRWPGDAWQLPGDSMLVFDLGLNSRATVFDAAGRAVRQIGFAHRMHRGVILQWPDSVLMSGAVARYGAANAPLHLLSFRGAEVKIARSFGSVAGKKSESGKKSDDPGYSELLHVLTLAPQVNAKPQVIAAAPNVYDITRLGTLLIPGQIYERRPEWFSGPSTMRFGNPETPPEPSLRRLGVDSAGNLWTVARVTSPRWREAWNGIELGERQEVATRALSVEYFFDTQVEVLDLRRGRVIARERITGVPIALLPGNRLVVYQSTITGEPQVRVVHLTLVRP